MEDWSLVKFEPLDVVVSADARPLDNGGFGHEGELSPLAFAGCLRTAILARAGYQFGPGAKNCDQAEEAKKAIGLGRDDGFPLRFAGPLLVNQNDTVVFPAPRHVTVGPAAGRTRTVLDRLAPRRDVRADGRLEPCALMRRPCPDHEAAEGWVEAATLAYSLTAVEETSTPHSNRTWYVSGAVHPRHALFASERRHGHRRSPAGVVEEQGLFRRGAERPLCGVGMREGRCCYGGLLKGIARDLHPVGQVGRLGGDGHLVHISIGAWRERQEFRCLVDLRDQLPQLLSQYRGLLLYLATPAIFMEGWRPTSFCETTPCELVGAAVGKPRLVAGWDLQKKSVTGRVGAPRRHWRAAPAGSVYFLRLRHEVQPEGLTRLAKDFFLNQSVSDVYSHLGFGLALLGVWDARGWPTKGGSS